MRSTQTDRRPCKGCGGLLPAGSAPQRKFCGPCRRERDSERKRQNRRLPPSLERYDERFEIPNGTPLWEWEEALRLAVQAAATLGDRVDPDFGPEVYLDRWRGPGCGPRREADVINLDSVRSERMTACAA